MATEQNAAKQNAIKIGTSWTFLKDATLGRHSWGTAYVRLYSRYTAQEPTNNRTKVQFQCRGYNNGYNFFDQQGAASVSGEGKTKSGSATSWGNYAEMTWCTTDEVWVTHEADGKKSVSGSASISLPNWGLSGTASGSGDLPQIDRDAPVITQGNITNITADGFTISASANVECKNWEYKINSGAWTSIQTTKATSLSKVISGLDPATDYTVQIRATRVYNEVVGTSESKSVTTLGGASIVSTQPIVIDLSQIINFNATFYNASYVNKLALKDGETTLIGETSIGTHAIGQNVPMAWELTAAQQTTILNHLSDTKNKTLQLVITSYDGSTLIGGGNSFDIVFSIEASLPTLNDFTYEDSNSASVGVTGDNQTLIQNQSTLKIEDLSATAVNGASISSWKYEIGQQTKEGNPTNQVFNFGVVESFGDLVLKVTAIDSRGNTASKQVTISTLRYSNISVESYYLHRTNNVEDEINLELSGKYTSVGSNALNVKRWRYREQGTETWSNWQNFGATGSYGSFSFDGILGELDNKKNFELYVEVGDKLTTTYFITTVLKGLYLMMFRNGNVGINTNDPQYDLDIQPKSLDDTKFLRIANGEYGMTDAQWQEIYDLLGIEED